MYQLISRLVHRLTYFFCIISAFAILIMMLLTSFDVVGRTVLSRPIPGTFEISQYLLVVAILLSIAYAQQEKQHIRVDILIDKMRPVRRIALNIFFTIIVFGFFVLLIWQGLSEGMFAMQVGKSSDVLHIPAYPFEMLVAVGALLICLELVLDLANDIQSLITAPGREEG